MEQTYEQMIEKLQHDLDQDPIADDTIRSLGGFVMALLNSQREIAASIAILEAQPKGNVINYSERG